MASLFKINLEDNKIYRPLIEDIIRFSTIQIVTHVFICLTNTNAELLDPNFFQTLFFLIVSIVVYWLIIKKVLKKYLK
jgi:hypothetical protein